jgi:hypothetical protein
MHSDGSAISAPTRKSLCLRCAKSAIVFGWFCGIPVVALLCFGGELADEGGGFGNVSYTTWQEYEHGWPMVSSRRIVFDRQSNRIMPWDGQSEWYWKPLLVDTLVALLLIAGCISLIGRAWRANSLAYSLRDLLLVVTVLCIALAHLYGVRGKCARASKAAAQLEERGYSVSYGYGGPLWLSRLLGTSVTSTELFEAPIELGIYDADDRQIKDIEPLLQQVPQLLELRADDVSASSDGFEILLRQPYVSRLRLLSLSGSAADDESLAAVDRCSSLQSIYLDSTRISDATILRLPSLGSLRYVQLSDTMLSRAAVEALCKCSSVREFDLRNTALTRDDIRQIESCTGAKVLF